MKKLSALFLTLVLLVSAVPAAFAENAAANTTTLTTTVPSATYVLNIPADQTVTFGEEYTYIGNVTVTDSKNFAVGKNVAVLVEYAPFAAETEEINTTIPYTLYQTSAVSSGEAAKADTFAFTTGRKLTFKGRADGTVNELAGVASSNYSMKNMFVKIKSEDWGKALAGDYKSTITFTSEIVVAE